MDVQPQLEYFETSVDDLCKFEMFGLTNATVVPVMITMTPGGPIVTSNTATGTLPPGTATIIQPTYINPLQQQQSTQYELQQQQQAHNAPMQQQQFTFLQQQSNPQAGIPYQLIPAKLTPEQYQQYETGLLAQGAIIADSSGTNNQRPSTHNSILYQKVPLMDVPIIHSSANNIVCPRHHNLPPLPSHIQTPAQVQKFLEASGRSSVSPVSDNAIHNGLPLAALQSLHNSLNEKQTSEISEVKTNSCIKSLTGGNSSNNNRSSGVFGGPEGCSVGCNALMIMGIGSGRSNNDCNNRTGFNNNRSSRRNRRRILSDEAFDEMEEDQMKEQLPCNCSYMNFDPFGDNQTTGFGGLPDVTEHSNIKRSTSRQDSLSNSESGEIISLQKSKQTNSTTKKSSKHGKKHKSSLSSSSSDGKHKKICIFSLSALTILVLCATIATIFLYQLLFMAPSRNSHDERMKIVRKILKEIPLIDGHNNLAWNVRKYAHSSLELLDLSHGIEQKTIWQRPQWSQTDILRLKEGLVGGQIWSAYVPCEAQGLDAVQLALEQIDIIHRFTELHPSETVLVTTSAEILQAHSNGLIASLIGIEGGHALGSSLGVLRSFHSLGARYLTLTHQCDITWAGSSSMTMEKGLTAFGKSVIKEMNRLGMLIDLSHSSDATCRDALEVTRAPVIFSHSVARALCNSSRNIPDDILRSVADNGGIIMVSFDSEYVSCGVPATLHDVVAHIKYIRSIAGIEHIGIGAGYDGILPPIGLEDVSKYPILFATLLEDPNWSDEDLAKLAGKNFIRVLKSVENVRDYWKRADIQPVEITEPIKKSQCTYMSS